MIQEHQIHIESHTQHTEFVIRRRSPRHLQKQPKQAITCSLMKRDTKYHLQNKKLIDETLPHSNNHHRDEWIKQCASYLTKYKKRESNVFINKYEKMRRDS